MTIWVYILEQMHESARRGARAARSPSARSWDRAPVRVSESLLEQCEETPLLKRLRQIEPEETP